MYGRIQIPENIPLSAPLIAALLVFGAIVIISGRPELSLGVFLALPSWTRPALVGPVAAFYFLAAITVVSTVVYLAQRRVIAPAPAHDRWILLWMGLWWLWTLVLVQQFRPPGMMDKIVVPLVLYILFPLPFLVVFGDDARRLNGLAWAYISTILLGGWLLLGQMNYTLNDLLADPMLEGLSSRGMHNFGLVNYHYFAYGTALSVIFAMILFLQARTWLGRVLLLLMAGAAGYFLFQAGSRQSLGALAAVMALLTVWGMLYSRQIRLRTLLIVTPLVLVGLYIYQTAPHLIVRENEQGLADSFNIVGSRGRLWEIALGYYVQSPLWGHGYTYSMWAHNVFIGVLVDQGFVGLIFLLGFLIFLGRRCFGVGATETDDRQVIWRMGLAGVVVFGLVHAQASGSVTSLWYLYWAGAIIWSISRAPHSHALYAEVQARRLRVYPWRPATSLPSPPTS